MNIRLLVVSILTCCGLHCSAQIKGFDANVEEYGQLKSVLGGDWDKIDSLSVTGPINATDFRTMWECAFYGNLSVLNLENAQVENNTIPFKALFDNEKQYLEVDEPIYLNIRRIILPNNITKIEGLAFYRMRLEKINLPSSLREFGLGSFGNCHWLNVDPLIIPEGVTEIPTQCFVNCQNFRKLVLPTTLRRIKENAFYNTRMEEVVFPEGMECIENAAFHGSGELKKAILPSTCLELGEYVFSMCDSLKELRLPEGIKRIPTNFASYCNVLEKVNIPETVEVIDENAFQWCFELKNIKLPAKLKSIKAHAFINCNIDSIVFPESLEYLGGGCCKHWKALKCMYIMSPNPPYCEEDDWTPGTYAFDGLISPDIPIYVPIGSAELYRNAQGWSYFNNFIEIDKFPSAGIYGIKTDDSFQSKVYWSNGNLNIEIVNDIELPVHYSIYTIDGGIVRHGYLETTHLSISLPKRNYIVQVGQFSYKIR